MSIAIVDEISYLPKRIKISLKSAPELDGIRITYAWPRKGKGQRKAGKADRWK